MKNILLIDINSSDILNRYYSFKERLLKVTEIKYVTASSRVAWNKGYYHNQNMVLDDYITEANIDVVFCDPDYLRVYEIPILYGKNFMENSTANEDMIVNEAAFKAFNWSSIENKKTLFRGYHKPIIGMVKNFYYNFPYEKVKPMVLFSIKSKLVPWFYLSIKLNNNTLNNETIEKINNIWKEYFPQIPFQYSILEKDISKVYNEVMGQIDLTLKISAIIIFLLATLGLFGFSSFETQRKIKEIGIRKALGAARFEIILIFFKIFFKIIIIANLISWPISFYLIRFIFKLIKYNQPFKIGFEIYLFTFIFSLIVTIITVGVQVFRSASANPVNSLRYE